jgi:hypothetical protein
LEYLRGFQWCTATLTALLLNPHSPAGVNVSSLSSILVALALIGSADLSAQGIATTAIRGTAQSDDGSDLSGASIRAINTATGVSSKSSVRQGRFLLQGLEIGGPYIVEIRHIGFVPQRTVPVSLTLGEPLEVHFTMRRVAMALDTVLVTTSQNARPAHGGGGSVTTIPDEFLHRLPTLDRNVFDFVRLAPQVSTKVGSQRIGLSAAGANLRFNNFLINGADERAINGNVSSGINGGKSIPIDAVKEYQVLVAPYDVRYGDFTGALVNTVTRSGTNHFRGSTFAFWRNNRLARGGDLASAEPYDRLQSGFSLGGPIVRDRIHFFVAAELQRLTSPADGPYVGQPSTALDQLRVNAADVDRIDAIMDRYVLKPGSAGPVTNRSALRNVFARIDASLPRWNSRLVAFSSYADSDDPRFSRAARDTFYLSTYKYTVSPSLRLTSVQFHTDLLRTSGGHNELIVSHVRDGQDFLVDVHQPIVRVLVPATDGGLITLNGGTAEAAQSRFSRNKSISIKDELTLPLKATHILVLGAQAERYQVQRGGISGGYGTWTFSSLDSLQQGLPERYELQKDFGSASAPLHGGQYAVYFGDEWRATEGLAITTGIRADALSFSSHAPFNPMVDSIFGRRTDELPRAHVHWSPRLGFTWDINGRGGDQLRGGIGVFVGRPPRAWIAPGVTSYGVGIGLLRCGSLATDGGLPPKFIANYESAPTACRNGSSVQTAPLGDVDLIDRNLRMAESQRVSLAYDRHLGVGTTLTTEALFSRNLSDFMFVNLNLKGPQTTDIFGRVLYGTIGGSGVATPALKSGFSEVIDLTNTAKNYSYQFTGRLEKRFANGIAATASYTYSRVRDVQSPSRVNVAGIALWADARAVSGRHDDLALGTSLNDLPHRVVTAITYTAPWQSGATEFSLYYVGESGSPFTYLAFGTSRRGDLNADGSNANDPIYVPRDVFDVREIVFSGRSDAPGADNSVTAQNERIAAQQIALDRFIHGAHCLERQRGSIIERNSCREPWSHTSIAGVRHSLPIGGHVVEAELDIFNVLNLLNSRWGRYRVSAPRLLEQVGQTPGSLETAQPVFRFDVSRPEWTTLQTESAFQLQLGIRYRL